MSLRYCFSTLIKNEVVGSLFLFLICIMPRVGIPSLVNSSLIMSASNVRGRCFSTTFFGRDWLGA